jgi:hypothetical protein
VENQLPAAAEQLPGLYSGMHVRDGALLLLTGIALYSCWLLAKPFLTVLRGRWRWPWSHIR